MKHETLRWFRNNRSYIYVGIGIWILLGMAGGLFALSQGKAVLPVVVTWDEWAAAILLFPHLVLWVFGIANLGRDIARRTWAVHFHRSTLMAAFVVFVLDLVVRAVAGLGWQPFDL